MNEIKCIYSKDSYKETVPNRHNIRLVSVLNRQLLAGKFSPRKILKSKLRITSPFRGKIFLCILKGVKFM